MDKLYGDYDKIFEQYKQVNIYKRKTEQNEQNGKNGKNGKNRTKKEMDEKTEGYKQKDKEKKGNICEPIEEEYCKLSSDLNVVDEVEHLLKERKKNNNKNNNNKSVYNNNYDDNTYSDVDLHINSDHINNSNLKEKFYNEYKIRKKISIEINKKMYSDSENMIIEKNKPLFHSNMDGNENSYVLKKKKFKNDDHKIIKIKQNNKDKAKFFIMFLFVIYYIFFFFHYIIDIQINQIFNIVVNTFTIIIITAMLCYIYFLKKRNKKLKKIIFYITTYTILLYCLHIFNTVLHWLNIYLNFTMSKKLYLKYKTLYKNISFIFSYFSFDEVFFFLLIFYSSFFITSSLLSLFLFYYIYNFINYSF
ncbi:conserved Plasmodium protein, unknown function [Plasmodium yoelii]|uniref:Uncharacterized protein n=1 Tax=Plasmodium yoelii TaxID=5861 RepID=A0A077YDF4_PLAYE|nr:conserved Plasmodium protein, unknown function [Plasmodium yoelii]CDU20169.1 conserved Plasmodium protein, unknown function [Plasmodium yoelii]VTZ80927.1 conserved Plasmodium protein, unknown function [Plasmodium yoelii]|eukprot:XP_022813709.1 conserved Plasmodium protein, unknown function [Plasmodium yoelii]